MIPALSISSLFPYTTLFRSSSLVTREMVAEKSVCGNDVDQHIERLIDRKSTRLNSSHLVSSYAVFCSKKKNKINTRTGEDIIYYLIAELINGYIVSRGSTDG